MKTPYDAALRVADKRLDKVRAEMARVASQLHILEREGDAAANALARECLLAMDDPQLTTERYFAHARDRRTQLMAMRDGVHARLEALRDKAVAHYAERIAIDTAIAQHRAEAERAAAAVEQAAIDDLTGSRYHRQPSRTPSRRIEAP